MKNRRKLTWPRLIKKLGLGLGALVFALALLLFIFGGTLLNSYVKARAQRAFAQANPGSVLRLGRLNYSSAANQLTAQSVSIESTNFTFTTGPISLTGVHWTRLLHRAPALAEVFAHSHLDVTNLEARFPSVRYGVLCARLEASVPRSELLAQGAELRTLVTDDQFFAASPYRATRFHVRAPECQVLGLAYRELLQGKSFHVASLHFTDPAFAALVSREKPVPPFEKPPLMVHEALAAIPFPLSIDRLSLTNGRIIYCERVVAGADPGVLTFGSVSLAAEGIANRVKPPAAIQLEGQGDLMDAATLKVRMTIPLATTAFSLRYSGWLSAMDLTRLNPFLDIAEHTTIKSGSAQHVDYVVEVLDGEARGEVRGIYQDLVIAFLNKDHQEKGARNRVASFLANEFKIRNANAPDATGEVKAGAVNYTRRPEDEFLQFVWFALRSGVLDAISK